MPYYTSLLLFLFLPQPCHFNGAISKENYTCTNTCFYKSAFAPQLFSKIKMALKSFCIIQQTYFAFWFCLHIGKLLSSNTKCIATEQFFADMMTG